MAVHRKAGSYWVRQELILEHVRGRIVAGELAPGARVPTRDELERQFRASRVTIQRAFAALIREGFVEPRGRSGTFVSERPPHLFRHGLVFPMQGQAPAGRSSFERALVRGARAMTRQGPHEFVVFEGFHGPEDLARFHTLEEDVTRGRIGGVIFAGEPRSYAGFRLLDAESLPRVSLHRSGTPQGMPCIELDRPIFFQKALGLLEGRSDRISLLTSGRDLEMDEQAFVDALGPTPCRSEPCWIHRVAAGEGTACRNLVALLMRGPPDRRPDGLILTEEAVLPDVLAGLADAGVDPTRDLSLVIETYRRHPVRSPVLSLAYDVRGLLDRCLSLIRAQQSGHPPASWPPAHPVEARP